MVLFLFIKYEFGFYISIASNFFYKNQHLFRERIPIINILTHIFNL